MFNDKSLHVLKKLIVCVSTYELLDPWLRDLLDPWLWKNSSTVEKYLDCGKLTFLTTEKIILKGNANV